jgi:hypothetical protein
MARRDKCDYEGVAGNPDRAILQLPLGHRRFSSKRFVFEPIEDGGG